MKITPIETNIIRKGDNLFEVISKNIKSLPEQSVLAIAAKIVSVCQGRLVKKRESAKFEKHELIKREADYYLDPSESRYGIMCTIKNNILGINAGVNECNVDRGYILLPEDAQNTANNIWKFLKNHYSAKKVGVIIVDSTLLPLRWGAIGIMISYCGFRPYYNYQEGRDIFGRKLSLPQINVADALAVSAVLEMGEAGEKRPFCIIEKVSKIRFQNRVPNQRELKNFLVNIKDDPFAPILERANWKKGRKN
jgi:F420-0:gamma-glutamyl ligase